MAQDLTAMIFRIAAELGSRFDLAGAVGSATQTAPNSEAVRNAITTAITEYQKQRFRFNEINPAIPTTFVTVPTQSVYTNADSPVIGSLYFVDYLNIRVANTLMQLSRNTPEQQHLNVQAFNQNGLPTSWAYEGNSIILYPVPDTAYTIYVGAHINIAPPAADNEVGNVWMTYAERLIRCRAKYEIATHVTRNREMQASLSPDTGETYSAWRALKAEGNKITGMSRVKPMAF